MSKGVKLLAALMEDEVGSGHDLMRAARTLTGAVSDLLKAVEPASGEVRAKDVLQIITICHFDGLCCTVFVFPNIICRCMPFLYGFVLRYTYKNKCHFDTFDQSNCLCTTIKILSDYV